jgi:hypothetical protein
MHKLSHKSMVMLYKSCRVIHKKTYKIGFVFVWFSLNFYEFFKIQAKHNYSWRSAWKLLKLHKTTRSSSNQALEHEDLHKRAPGGGGELAAGDVRPVQANKWDATSIGHTTDLLRWLGWRHRRWATTVSPRQHVRFGLKSGEVRGNAGKQVSVGAQGGPTGGA